MSANTLYDKIWNSHLVDSGEDGSALIYIDRHLIHEVTSPQAFEGLRIAGRQPWRRDANIAMPDHNVSTDVEERRGGYAALRDETSRIQLQALDDNCDDFGIAEFRLNDVRQGIVHIVGPETGAVLPGMTVVCGDSHTSTHGALGVLAMGIGTSEVEHVLATQCLSTQKMKNMRIRVEGKLGVGVTPKDVILAIIGQIGTAGGTGYAIEFAGQVFRDMSVEGRMTVCNMAIEAGARVGLIAADEKTFAYVEGRPFAPKGEQWELAKKSWADLHSDAEAIFDAEILIKGDEIAPQVTWGTSPEMVAPINGSIPREAELSTDSARAGLQRAMQYMGLEQGAPIASIELDRVFIGSCTNARIEDLRAVASVVKGYKKSNRVKQAMVVPGSGQVRAQAEAEGLHQIFLDAGFEWRAPGCSMCLAMNADKLGSGEHCASTSNRNFEGRQGFGGCTHLVSPAMAAAAAISGHFVDIREWEYQS